MQKLKFSAALSVFLLALGAAPAHATTYTITGTSDGGGAGALSTDVAAAQNGDTITFNIASPFDYANLTSSYAVNTNQIWNGTVDFTNNLTIGGTGTLTTNFASMEVGELTITSGRTNILGTNNSIELATVNSGATLGGTGTMNGLDGEIEINNGGTLAPGIGNTPGTLTVTDGEVVFNSNSNLVIAVTPTATSQLASLFVFAQGTVNVTLNPQAGAYTVGHQYVIDSSSSLSNPGDFVLTNATNSAGKFELLTSTPDELILEYLGPNGTSLATIALTANQRSVGNVFDRISAGSPPAAYSTLFTNLSAQSTAQQQTSLDQLNGTMSANLQSAGISNARLVMNTIQSRLGGGVAASGGSEVAMVDNDGPFQVADADNSFWGPAGKKSAHLTAWMQGFGEFDSISGNSTAAGVTSTVGGGAVGVENHFFGQDDKAGVSFSGANASLSLQGVPQTGTQNTYALSVYGSKGIDVALSDLGLGDIGLDDDTTRHLVLDGTLLGAYNTATSTRYISATGETAQGSTDGYSFGLDGGMSYPVTLDEGSILTPRIGLDYTYNYENGYSETGAPVGGLTVGGNGQNMLQTSLGGSIKHKYDLPDWRDSGSATADTITPEIHAAWTHEILNPRSTLTESFSGLAGSSFTSYGAAPDRDAAAIGIGASYVPGDATQISIYARYDAVISANQTDNMVTGGFKYSW